MHATRSSRTTPAASPAGDPPASRPDLAFLHVQGVDASPVRVFELPAGPVRVGGGAQSEVRVAGPGLADVQCILRPKGDAWHLQPVGPPGQIWVDGRPADAPGPLVFGVPFRVGDEWLTLRSPENATNDWGSFADPITIQPQPAEDPAPPPRQGSDPVEDRVRRWQSRVEARERWLKDQQEERRWEARWKAAGETIRARTGGPSPVTPRPGPPPVAPRTPPSARAAEPPVTPRTSPSARAAEPPRVVPRPAEPFRRVLGAERREIPGREATRPRALMAPKPTIEPFVEPPRGLVALPPSPVVEAAPAPVETPPEPVAERLPGPIAEVEIPPVEEEVELAAEPEVEVEVAAEPVAELEAPAEPVVEAPRVESSWATSSSFATDTFDSLPEMVWVAPTAWPEAPARAPAEPLAIPARPAPEPLAAPPPRGAEPSRPGTDYPSARTIFAAQGRREAASPEPVASRQARAILPEPTESRAPAQWTLPLWLGLVPAAAVALASGLLASALALTWVEDGAGGDLAARIALRPGGTAGPFIDLATIPRGPWWRTTAPHLSAWAVAVGRLTDGEDHSADVRELIEEARNTSRLAAGARFGVEAPPGRGARAEDDLSHLGRPRDVVPLAATGRTLKRLGKVESAIRAYRSAFVMAAGAERADLPTPGFDEAQQVHRYALIHDPILGIVAREMVGAGPWTPEQWAEALPPFAPAYLAAARALRPKDQVGADRLLETAAGLGDRPTPVGLDPAEHRAGAAEALALRGRWTDSAAAYKVAIESAIDDATRRMWSLNLAEVAQRMGDPIGRARALEAAKDAEAGDEITRRAVQLSQAPGGFVEPTRRP